MSTTLTPNSGSPVVLDRDMIWEDEASWSPITATVVDTIGGGQVVQAVARGNVGRPITLVSRDGFGRQTRAKVDALAAMLHVVGRTVTLSITDGTSTRTINCRPRYEDAPAVEATQAYPVDGLVGAGVWYEVKIKLVGV